LRQTQLTASAGVSYNKMLAKIASDLNKPNGIEVITPEQGLDFIANLPVKKFHGIGKATVKMLHDMGIFTGLDLRNTPADLLKQRFGKRGDFANINLSVLRQRFYKIPWMIKSLWLPYIAKIAKRLKIYKKSSVTLAPSPLKSNTAILV